MHRVQMPSFRALRVLIPAGWLGLALTAHAQATATLGGLEKTAGAAGYSTGISTAGVIGSLVSGLIGLAGLIFIVMIVWGGVQYLVAQGEPERVKKAKDTLVWSILGLVVMAAAYVLTQYVFTALGKLLS